MKLWCAGLWGLVAGAGLIENCLAQTKPVAPATPEAAAEWALSLPENTRKQTLQGVLSGWAQTDPIAAGNWVRELPEGDLKKSMQEALARPPTSTVPVRRRVRPIPPPSMAQAQKPIVLSFETPEDLAKVMALPVNQSRQDALMRYTLDWFGRDKDKATQWVSANLKGYVLSKTAGAIAREWSKSDLPAAAEWVRQIPPFWKDFVVLLGSEWASEKPEQVAKIVLQWPDSLRRQVILRGVCDRWAQQDPQAAAAWSESLPVGPARTEIRKGLMIGWAGKDVVGLSAWSETLTDPEEKRLLPHLILHGLGRANPAEGLAQLKNWPAGGESSPSQTVCFGKEWASGDAVAAANWAKALPEGTGKEVALKSVLRIWAYQDAVAVARWAEQLPEKGSRLSALEALMETWVEQNRSEAMGWAQEIKQYDIKLEALSAAVRIWGQAEPREALDWVNQLPEGVEKAALLEEVQHPRLEGIAVGEAAPDFTVDTLGGKTLKLSDYRGKYVLLDFWATWCGPCRGETPNLKKVFETYGKRENFALIGLSLDPDVEKPKAYLEENGCAWIDGFLGDWGKDKVTKKYGVRGIPAILLIGPDGKVVANQLRGDAIMAAVSAALDSKK